MCARTVVIGVPGQPGTRLRVEVHHPQALVTAVVASGLGLPLAAWQPVVAALPDVCLIVVDRPGIGGSTAWTTPPGGLADQVALLRLVLDTCRGEDRYARVVVVGHSYGALIAEGFARTYPERTAALVLLDPSVPAEEATRRQVEGWVSDILVRGVAWRGVADPVGRVVGRATVALGTSRTARGEAAREVRAAFRGAVHLRATLLELARIRGEARDLLALAATHPLPPVPVRLLVGTRRGWPLRWVRGPRRGWMGRMGAVARDLGSQVAVDQVDGAHLLTLDAPGTVAAAIRHAATAAMG